jgi:hypothetical protein
MAATFKTSFHRLFGDADGDRDVDSRDRKAFMKAYKSKQFGPRYVAYFDHDSDGDVDKADLAVFNQPQRVRDIALGGGGVPKKQPAKSGPKVAGLPPVTVVDAGAVDFLLAEGGLGDSESIAGRPRVGKTR